MHAVEKIKGQTQEKIREIKYERTCPNTGAQVGHALRAYQCNCSTCQQAETDIERANRRFQRAQAAVDRARREWQDARTSAKSWSTKGTKVSALAYAYAADDRPWSREHVEEMMEMRSKLLDSDTEQIGQPEYISKVLERELGDQPERT